MSVTITQLRSIVEHAQAWALDGTAIEPIAITLNGAEPEIDLRPDEITAFVRWARTLAGLRIVVQDNELIARGRLASSVTVTVHVHASRARLDAAGMHGTVTLNQVEWLAFECELAR